VNRYLIIVLAGDPRVYGIFDIALKVGHMGLNCLQVFAVPLFSVFTGYGQEKIGEIKQILKRCFVGLGGAYILGCLLFLLLGGYLFDIIFQKEGGDLFHASLILIPGIALFGVAEPFYRALMALGHLRLTFIINLSYPTISLTPVDNQMPTEP